MTTRILINHVKRATCAVYGVTTTDLEMRDRHKRFAEPRQMAMAVARQLTEQSHANIGRAFARDDTTVIRACSAVNSRLLSDPRDYETFQEIGRVARCYAEGTDATPTISRAPDVFAHRDVIRTMREENEHVSPWVISQRLGLPVAEVSKVLEGA